MIPRGCICLPWVADQRLSFPGPLGLSVPEDSWVVAPCSSHISRVVSWETVLTHNASPAGREVGRCPETRVESWLCHGRTLHKSLPSQAPGPRHGPGVCPEAWHSDQAGGLLALRGLIIRAQAASPRSCASGQSEVHTDVVRGQHPSGGPGTVSPPLPASSWVSEVCAVGPFYR